jgi:hypothetical protein
MRRSSALYTYGIQLSTAHRVLISHALLDYPAVLHMYTGMRAAKLAGQESHVTILAGVHTTCRCTDQHSHTATEPTVDAPAALTQ